MEFSLWLPATLPWTDLLSAARHARATGWRGVWIEDHFMANAADPNDEPRQEALTVLAALAASVPDIRIGSLVLGNTYRHPAIVAKQAAAISEISDGRFVLGVGAGWQENEHRAFGIEYGDVPSRIRWFHESLQVWTGLRDHAPLDFSGERYALERASLSPRPHERLPILVGGKGERVMPRLVARYADEWNLWSTPEQYAAKNAIFTEALEREGRDPATLWRTTQALTFHEEGGAERAAGSKRAAIGGRSEQLVETMRAYRAAGVDEYILPATPLRDLAAVTDAADRFMTEVVPHVD